jgi:hypothetical protein
MLTLVVVIEKRYPPFTEHFGADCVRLVVVLLLSYLIAVALKMAWIRWRHRRVFAEPQDNPWIILSYVMLAVIPVWQSVDRFGHSLDIPRTSFALAALVFGAVGAYQEVTLRRWNWIPQRWHRAWRERRRRAAR